MNETLLVNRKDFGDVTIARLDDEGDLGDGFICVRIGPFAMTANNVTYMVTGDQIGYWKYFNPEAYGIDASQYGRMPVWGYGEVIDSKCADVLKGTKIYGFFPVAKTIDMKPVKINKAGFQDGADHRIELHSVYNTYVLTDADPSFMPEFAEIQPVLRPLFTTSFLIDDYLADNDFFGAKQIILTSASSKTALGTAFCLSQRGTVDVIGLTSTGNVQFVDGTGFYGAVGPYELMRHMNPDVKTAIVDMAGNGQVMASLYDHFGDNIVYNCMVGKSHWQGEAPPKVTAGAPPVMFFAPDRAKQRFKDWGPEGFTEQLAMKWMPFCLSADEWLTIETEEGMSKFLPCYKDHLDGNAEASKGYLFKL